MPFRFIHSSDLHLGRRFGTLPEAVRGRLVEARHQIIATLARAAREHGAEHILIAGDIFDTAAPSDPVWRQAVAAMGAAPGLQQLCGVCVWQVARGVPACAAWQVARGAVPGLQQLCGVGRWPRVTPRPAGVVCVVWAGLLLWCVPQCRVTPRVTRY